MMAASARTDAMNGRVALAPGAPGLADEELSRSEAPFPSSTAAPPDLGVGQLAALQQELGRRLGPEYVSTRPSGGGIKVSYIEGWKVVDLANEIFGFNGWSSEVKDVRVHYLDTTSDGRYNVGVSSTVRITLRDGTYREDVGWGDSDNGKTKGMALEKASRGALDALSALLSSVNLLISYRTSGPQAQKEAATDAMKRALKSFGPALGNCLYDKAFINTVNKMKPMKPDYNLSNLRRPSSAGVAASRERIEAIREQAKPDPAALMALEEDQTLVEHIDEPSRSTDGSPTKPAINFSEKREAARRKQEESLRKKTVDTASAAAATTAAAYLGAPEPPGPARGIDCPQEARSSTDLNRAASHAYPRPAARCLGESGMETLAKRARTSNGTEVAEARRENSRGRFMPHS